MQPLTLKYRPRVLADVVGQERTTSVIRAMVKRESVPPCLIFGGTRGAGKTTTARILPAALNCPNRTEEGDPCGSCASCKDVWSTSSNSVLEIDAASNNGIEEIRKIKDLAQYASEGKYRVFVIDEAHGLSVQASNALLKVLEEPPPNTIFILLTTETHKILETIRSRAMNFEFQRIKPQDIAVRLKRIAVAEQIPHTNQMLIEIARMAKGGMRDAVMTLDQARLTGCEDLEAFQEQFGTKESACAILTACVAENVTLVADLAADAVARSGDSGRLFQELIELVRDLIVIKAGGTPPCMEQQLAERTSLADAIPNPRLYPALRLLWGAKERARTEDDQLTAAQIVCLLLADGLGAVAKEEPINTTTSVAAALSLKEMTEMVNASGLG